MDSIHVTRVFTLAILIMLITGVFFPINDGNHRPPSSVQAFHFYPFTKFHLLFQNRISTSSPGNVIQLDCQKDIYTGGGGETTTVGRWYIQPNQDSGWSFRTSVDVIDYICTFNCLGRQGSFTAFMDVPEFADGQCGGRHCTWMFKDDGVYLFNIKDQMYHQKIIFNSNNNATTSTENAFTFIPKV